MFFVACLLEKYLCRGTGPFRPLASPPARATERRPTLTAAQLLPAPPAAPPLERSAGKPRGHGEGGGGHLLPFLRRLGTGAAVRSPGVPFAGVLVAAEARSGAAPAGSGGRVAGARVGGWRGRQPAF